MGDIVHKEKLFIEKYIDGIFKRLDKEIRYLHKWFKENYPKGHLEVSVEFSKIRKTVYLKTRIFQERERVSDRDSFLTMVIIEEKSLINPRFMDPFLMILNEKYREEITRLLRNHSANKRVLLEEAI